MTRVVVKRPERVDFLKGQAAALRDPAMARQALVDTVNDRARSAFWCGIAKGVMSPQEWAASFDRVLAVELGCEPECVPESHGRQG